MSDPINQISPATIERKRAEAQKLRQQADALKKQSEALQRRGEEVQQKESELEAEADRLNVEAYGLERDRIPAMVQEISSALSRLTSLEDEDRNSLARQEECRAKAKSYLAEAERLIQEASRKRTEADVIWGDIQDEQDTIDAAALGQEAVRLETEAQAAQNLAEENDAEACRLRDLDLSRAHHRAELEEHRASLKTRIEHKRQVVAEARNRVQQLKTEEGRLRQEEGVYCSHALNLLEQSDKTKDRAREVDQEADDMENQIREDENLSGK